MEQKRLRRKSVGNEKTLKVLFTYYPLYVDFNHGSALLTAICKQRNIDADYAPVTSLPESMKNYDVIAFSLVTDADYQQCIPYMESAMLAGKMVLAGGVYARRGGHIDSALVHHICRGEAETLPEFLLNGDMSIFKEVRYQESLDGLPMPDLSHVKGNEFHRGIPFLQGLKIIPYQTSRGCPYQCSFCEVQYQPKGVRIKHTIHDEVKRLQRDHSPDLLYTFDELPPYYLAEWREQWKGLYAPFLSYIRADIEPEHLEFMIEHGLKVAAFGVESTDEDFRNGTLKKGITDAQIMRTANILNKHDIKYMAFYMSGVPGETPLNHDIAHIIGGYPIVWQYQDLQTSIMQEA